ncbi:ABC transporter permease [Celeribacter indicus]|uniref:Binding-protein-dependent transport system inner membrane component n=1 Tax=Celeribacter indicus TaxID=1208324 RepID=A0A0B5E072_9RHOB|nr:ABC transporter permease [Celeribacter indicus]AJE49093.1 Binding-protein-dependent transport system inner membrane component [Celeribacter indicus]SDW45731.1 putative spermidine/putrescine transport system permease protein [Celeribacter indicus]
MSDEVTHAATPRWLGLWPAAMLCLFFLVPFCIMLAVSVAHRDVSGFYEWGFEPDSYARFLSAFFGKVMAVSLSVSLAAAAICVALGFPFTVFLASMGHRTQTRILVVLLSVLALSEVIIGFSLSTLLSRTAGVGNLFHWFGLVSDPRAYTPSLFALVTGLCYIGFPFAVLVLYPPVSRLDPEIVEAARVMGASGPRAFFGVIVPNLRGAIVGAFILVFVFTLGSYLLPQLLGRSEHWTLSVHITDQAIYQSNLPFAAAMSVFLMLVALALVGLASLAGRDRGAA